MNSYCEDKMVVRSSYLYNVNPSTNKTEFILKWALNNRICYEVKC